MDLVGLELQVVVNCSVWALGTKPSSSARAVCALKVLGHLTNLPFLFLKTESYYIGQNVLSLFSFLFMCVGTCVYYVCLSVNTPPCQEKVSVDISITLHIPSRLTTNFRAIILS